MPPVPDAGLSGAVMTANLTETSLPPETTRATTGFLPPPRETFPWQDIPPTAPLNPLQTALLAPPQRTQSSALNTLCEALAAQNITSFAVDPIRASLNFIPAYYGFAQPLDGYYLYWKRGGLGDGVLGSAIRHEIPDTRDHLYWAVYMGSHFIVDARVVGLLESITSHPITRLEMTTARGPRMARYAAPVVALMEKMEWRNARFAELGCGEGLLSLVALEAGAAAGMAIDLDATNGPRIRRNLELNGLDVRRVDFADMDINSVEAARRLRDFAPDTVLASLGPHYGNTDLQAIRMAALCPEVQYLVLGGYTDEWRFSSATAVGLAEELGFVRQMQFINIMGRFGFLAILMTRPI